MDMHELVKEAFFQALKRRFGGRAAVGDPKGLGVMLPAGGAKTPSHSMGQARGAGVARAVPEEGADAGLRIIRSFIVRNPKMVKHVDKRNLAHVQRKFEKFRDREFNRLGLTPEQRKQIMRTMPKNPTILGARVHKEHSTMAKDTSKIPHGVKPPTNWGHYIKRYGIPAAGIGAGGAGMAYWMSRDKGKAPPEATQAQGAYDQEGEYGY